MRLFQRKPKPSHVQRLEEASNRWMGIAIIAVLVALVVANTVGEWAFILALAIAALCVAGFMFTRWWQLRVRLYGIDLEERCLRDLSRMGAALGIPVKTNVPVPGCGDADALAGKAPTLVEIKAWRDWNPADTRAQAALSQVHRLQKRLGVSRVVIWLPNAKPTAMQRMGFDMGLPAGVKVAFGGLWAVLIRVR